MTMTTQNVNIAEHMATTFAGRSHDQEGNREVPSVLADYQKTTAVEKQQSTLKSTLNSSNNALRN
jgi:hypothetical protein